MKLSNSGYQVRLYTIHYTSTFHSCHSMYVICIFAGSGAENFVVSANIHATKPLHTNSSNGTILDLYFFVYIFSPFIFSMLVISTF